MREDMWKVVVERPRKRGGYDASRSRVSYPRHRARALFGADLDDAPRIEAMGRGYRDKYLNENLQPLVRFLRAHVGRPWDKVRSEIAAQISCGSAVQKHVLDHLADFVVEHPIVTKKRRVLYLRWGKPTPLESRGMRLRFFVCPRSGLLRLAPFAAKRVRRSLAAAAPAPAL